MTDEEAKEYLKEILEEIEENHKNGELILVQNPTTKELKEAIEVVLKEIEYLKKNQRYKKDFNGEKIFCLEYDKETLRDMVLEKQEEIKELKSNSIPKYKIRELLENNYDISTENSRSMSYDGAFGFVEDIEELLEEEE